MEQEHNGDNIKQRSITTEHQTNGVFAAIGNNMNDTIQLAAHHQEQPQDAFANDEVAFLLDDIRGLETSPAICNDNDQEYEIAGSQADLDLTLQLDSPYESSWYSHANYRQYMNQMPSTPWGVPLHCDLRRLKTPTGIIRFLLVVS